MIFLETNVSPTGILITTSSKEIATITTSITESGTTYYYMYFVEGVNVDKVFLIAPNLYVYQGSQHSRSRHVSNDFESIFTIIGLYYSLLLNS